jgi:sigma-B regulation protein RsbU (phosphoserine phosphatase)
VITYLFVGLTPIVLTGLLGLIAAFGISAEGMAHVLAVEVDALGRQALEAARLLAAEAARRRDAPLQERTAWLRPFLSNVRVRLDPELPSWLAGRSEWQGVTHEPAAAAPERPPGRTPGEAPGVRLRIEEPSSHAVRAVARASGPAGDRTVLLEMPLDDAIIARLRETTGIAVQPIEGMRERLRAAEEAIGNADPRIPYMVLLPMTDWTTGETGERVVFTFAWSWAEAGRHLLGSGMAGNVWRRLLMALCFVFLGFEVLALVAAAWMTRAVTGTVHELYRATGYIDRGEFSHRVRVRSRDQLGELAESFNDMTAHIESLLRERVESERLQRELEIAAAVQSRLFPRTVPALATAEIAGHCRAARGVAGDYYDYLDAGPGTVALALGDVAGKGISAALLMSNLQASLRAQVLVLAQTAPAARADGAVAHLASLINEQLCRTVDSNRFATLFLALYDDAARTLRYTNAGHNPPILVLPDGRVERLSAGGVMVGAFSGHRFTQAEADLAPGSVLLLYSDGLSEAANAAGEEFGDGRLADLARRHAGLPAEALRQAVFDAVDAWTRGAEQVDDQTLVVVRGRPGAA